MSVDNEEQDSHAKLKKKPNKPGRHTIIALRQTAGSSFTSTSSSDTKRKENASSYYHFLSTYYSTDFSYRLCSPEPGPSSKKLKKSHQPPSGVHSSWKKTQKSGQSTHLEQTKSDSESAVRYGGLMGDSENVDVESSIINLRRCKRWRSQRNQIH
jgi:hypothetical protein